MYIQSSCMWYVQCHIILYLAMYNMYLNLSHLRLTSSSSSSSSSIFSSMSLLILFSDVISDSAVLLVWERTSDSRSSFSWRICLFSSSSCYKIERVSKLNVLQLNSWNTTMMIIHASMYVCACALTTLSYLNFILEFSKFYLQVFFFSC